MHSISRRGLVISAATAAAAFGLDGPLTFIAPAGAQAGALDANGSPKAMTDKGFVTFKVGDIEVTQLYDGAWEKPHDAGFIANASIDETKAALKAGGMTDAYVPVPFTITVVKMGGKTIMFDAGTGAQGAPTAGLIQKNNLLAVAGIDPKSIGTIVVTHFHADHIFGLMAKETNAQVYPDAEIIVPAAEYKYWTDPGTIAKLPEGRQPLAKRIQATLPTWKNIKQVDDGQDAIAGVRAMSSYGHTPGHTSYLLASGGKQLVVSGDVTNNAALFMRNPTWRGSIDQDQALAETSRKTFFEKVVADGAIVTGYHWGMPGAGTIKKDGSGYALVPVSV
jgi:glyoxylase-like metal-dependent hydrolase (beta-lactamase superfamily II)